MRASSPSSADSGTFFRSPHPGSGTGTEGHIPAGLFPGLSPGQAPGSSTRARPFAEHRREHRRACARPHPLGEDDSPARGIASGSQHWSLERKVTWEWHCGAESGRGWDSSRTWEWVRPHEKLRAAFGERNEGIGRRKVPVGKVWGQGKAVGARGVDIVPVCLQLR